MAPKFLDIKKKESNEVIAVFALLIGMILSFFVFALIFNGYTMGLIIPIGLYFMISIIFGSSRPKLYLISGLSLSSPAIALSLIFLAGAISEGEFVHILFSIAIGFIIVSLSVLGSYLGAKINGPFENKNELAKSAGRYDIDEYCMYIDSMGLIAKEAEEADIPLRDYLLEQVGVSENTVGELIKAWKSN